MPRNLKMLGPIGKGVGAAYRFVCKSTRRRSPWNRVNNLVLQVRAVRIGTDPLDSWCVEVTTTNERAVPVTLTGAYFTASGLGRFHVDRMAQERGYWRRRSEKKPSEWEPPRLPHVLQPGDHWRATLPVRGMCEELEKAFQYRAEREQGTRAQQNEPVPKEWKTVFEVDLAAETVRMPYSIEKPQMHVWPWEF